MDKQKTITLTAPFPALTVRVDDKGRWSLNDIHKQLVGSRACDPGQWCRSVETGWYVKAIEDRGIDFPPITATRGVGCYVLPELAISYIMDAMPHCDRRSILDMHKYLSEKYSGPTGICPPFSISTLELSALLGIPVPDVNAGCERVKEQMEDAELCSTYMGDDRCTAESSPEPHYIVGWLIAWTAATALVRQLDEGDNAGFVRGFRGVLALETKVRDHYVAHGFSKRYTPFTLGDSSGSLEASSAVH